MRVVRGKDRIGPYWIAALLWTAVSLSAGEPDPRAQPGDLEPIYVTATVWEKALTDTTNAVSIISREEINQLAARSLADLLPFLPGLTPVVQGGRGGLSTAQIRGGDPNYTLVLLDGMPLNDPTYQVGDVFDLSGLSLQGIERIEIVRGPLSAFYGSTGLAGVINLISAKQQPSQFALSGGDGHFAAAEATLSGSASGKTYSLNLGYEEEKERIAKESFQQFSLRGNLLLPLSGDRHLNVHAHFSDWQADDYPDASGGPLFGSGDLRRSDHLEIAAGLRFHFGEAMRQKLELGLYRHEMDRRSPAVFPMVPAAEEETELTTVKLAWQTRILDSEDWHLDAGADAVHEDAENQGILFLPPFLGGNQNSDYSQSRTRGGAFLALTRSFEHGRVELSTRWDLLENRAPQWNPRLGFHYRPGGGGLNLHGNIGRAFKLPSFFATVSPPALGGNPDLKPEKALGGDLGLDLVRRHYQLGLTTFFNRYQDLVDFDFDTFSHVNRSEVEAYGVEFAASTRFGETLDLRINATWMEVEDLTSGQPLRHRPKWSGGLRLAYRPGPNWNFQLDAQSVSQAYDQQIPVTDRFTTAGYTIYGLTAVRHLFDTWQIRLRLDNLTDKTYETLIGYPGAPRSFRLSLRFTP